MVMAQNYNSNRYQQHFPNMKNDRIQKMDCMMQYHHLVALSQKTAYKFTSYQIYIIWCFARAFYVAYPPILKKSPS